MGMSWAELFPLPPGRGEGKGRMRQAYPSERVDQHRCPAETGEPGRTRAVVDVMLHGLGGDDNIAHRQPFG
jgi:hypothetical protein